MRLIEYQGKSPEVDASATITPTATLVGDVTVGSGSVVLFGAVVTAESGPVSIGKECVIMENAVLRGVSHYPLVIEDNVLVGPHAHLTGCHVEGQVFIATGSCVFNGAVLETGSTVRINGVVHVRSRLPAGKTMPIGWVAVGDPAEILPPEKHHRLGELMQERDFSGSVFGLEKRSIYAMTKRYCRHLKNFRSLLPGDGSASEI